MTICICVDDNMGILFNRRRVSRDGELISRLTKKFENRKIFIKEYSLPLFTDHKDRVCIFEDITTLCEDAVCFLEEGIERIPDNTDRIITYHWNRKYPSDTYFYIDEEKFGCVCESEFKGSSHDKISERTWIRK